MLSGEIAESPGNVQASIKWASRVPQTRHILRFLNTTFGLLKVAIALGKMSIQGQEPGHAELDTRSVVARRVGATIRGSAC